MIPVLLADDHPFMRAGVEAVLRGTRFNIVGMANDGDEALELVARRDPTICIFDIRMPKKTGVEALQALRASGDMRPVVLLTAALEDRSLLAAVCAGVNGIVLKDGAEDALLARETDRGESRPRPAQPRDRRRARHVRRHGQGLPAHDLSKARHQEPHRVGADRPCDRKWYSYR
jgi:two-component system nitrate/nitrite response regulator NarP